MTDMNYFMKYMYVLPNRLLFSFLLSVVHVWSTPKASAGSKICLGGWEGGGMGGGA